MRSVAEVLPLPVLPANALAMTDAQFAKIRDLAHSAAGICLPPHKKSMAYRRISKRVTALGLGNFGSYVEMLSAEGGASELEFFVNALTTNKTSFFREDHHFQHMACDALPAIRKAVEGKSAKCLRIWSAGSSTGAEAYSIAMTLMESLPDITSWDARILATDIDSDMVRYASSGVYEAGELGGVSNDRRQKFFNKLDESHWGIADSVRELVVFNHLNLHAQWPMRRKFEIIFCRNVVIYFDKPTQEVLFDRFAEAMADNAILYIGHSESLYRVTDRFVPCGQSAYRKVR